MPKDWEALCPNLNGQYIEHSEATRTYNCAAFAVGDNENWWDPLPPQLYFWPLGVARGYEVLNYIEAFKTQGFELCKNSVLEEGQEKIAIYANPWGCFEHAARQLPDGRWVSKMAEDEDIIHDALDVLVGYFNATPTHFMTRTRKS